MAGRIRVWKPHERFGGLGKLTFSLHAHPPPTCLNVCLIRLWMGSIIQNPHRQISVQWLLMRVIYLASDTVFTVGREALCVAYYILLFHILWRIKSCQHYWTVVGKVNPSNWLNTVLSFIMATSYRICFVGVVTVCFLHSFYICNVWEWWVDLHLQRELGIKPPIFRLVNNHSTYQATATPADILMWNTWVKPSCYLRICI